MKSTADTRLAAVTAGKDRHQIDRGYTAYCIAVSAINGSGEYGRGFIRHFAGRPRAPQITTGRTTHPREAAMTIKGILGLALVLAGVALGACSGNEAHVEN